MKEVEKRPKIWYDYSKFLLKEIEFDRKEYSKLMKYLHEVPFIWCNDVIFDENRAKDGVYQRYYFFKSIGLKDGDFPYPCSVLEMLVAFTLKVSRNWWGYDREDMGEHIDRIFMLFLTNLELDRYENDRFDEISEAEIDDILNFWMKREYKNDGIGSIFPLKRPVKGYKNEEIFKQLMIYITKTGIDSVEKLRFFDKKLQKM